MKITALIVSLLFSVTATAQYSNYYEELQANQDRLDAEYERDQAEQERDDARRERRAAEQERIRQRREDHQRRLREIQDW